MGRDDDFEDPTTRREYVKYGGAVLAGGLVAGCTGGSDSTPSARSGTEATAERTGGSDTEAADDAEREETDAGDSYVVSMAPVGDVEFERVPESVFTRLTHLAGMAFAVGRGDDVNAMHAPEYYDALWNQFTERLDGVALDWTGLYSSWEVSKEKLYELDSDVHLADPASVIALDGWDESDVAEIANNVSPWFGNAFSDGNREPPEEYADRYNYYDLWEMFERVARVFREEARYEALAEVRANLVERVRNDLPPEGDRPTAVMVAATDPEQGIYAYRLDDPGFRTSHTRAAGAVGAFGSEVESGTTVDFETLLDADPDVLLVLGGMHPNADMRSIRATLEDDPVAAEMSAVKNGRVHAQGARYQGPILNLFQIEMTAKQLYPDRFGAWPAYETGPYPEIPEGERLFDRDRVAAIVRGEF